jgi:hypothetical protein
MGEISYCRQVTLQARGTTISGDELRQLTTFFTGVLGAFGHDDNIFSIYCSTGEFLLDFLKVIINTNFCLSPLRDSLASRHAVYDAAVSELRYGAFW